MRNEHQNAGFPGAFPSFIQSRFPALHTPISPPPPPTFPPLKPRSIAARPTGLLAALGICALVLAAVFFAYAVHAQGQGVTPTGDATGENPPAQPTNLQASAEHDSVSLTWEASPDQTVTHYAVLRRDLGTDASGVFHVIDANAGPGTSYTDASVSAQGSYVYRVKVVSPTGVSQWSSYARAETPAAPEPTPGDLAPSGLAVNLVENRVTLTWEAPAGDAGSVTGYEILRRRPKEGENALQTLVADTGNAATTADEPGVRYTYRVKALRGSDLSRESNFAFIDLPEDYTPEPEPASEPDPAALAPASLTAGIVDDGGVSLSWEAPAQEAESVTGYEILRAQGEAQLATLVEDTESTSTAYTDPTATEPGETYAYRVIALRGEGQSQGSNQAGVLIPHSPEDLAPSSLTAGLVDDGGVALSWDAPAADAASVTGYEVERTAEIPGDENTRIRLTPTGNANTTYNDDSADEPGARYTYRVQALRDAERSGWSNAAHVDLPGKGPGKPEDDPPVGARQSATPADFTLHADNDEPWGIWSDGTTMWVADRTDEKLYAYVLTPGGDYGDRDSNKDFDLADNTNDDLENGNPRDIWSDGTTMWVADWFDRKLFAYLLTPGDDYGDRFPALALDLAGVGNNYPHGIWSDGSTVWVADWFDDKLYAHALPANTPATGAPFITGILQQGRTLTADTSGIEDEDGIPEDAFSYQWVSGDGATDTDTDIDGATGPTYILTSSEVGKFIKVRVSFTDGGGFEETLTSGAVGPVAAITVLVSNTGQSDTGTAGLPLANPKRAQGFTTGSNDLGYTLSSIGVSFHNISSVSTAASELTATLNEADGSEPGDVLCTLEHPSSYGSSGVHTYGAPATGENACPTLTRATPYFFVLERAHANNFIIGLDYTNRSGEDATPAPGWSIMNQRHHANSAGAWSPLIGTVLMIEVTGAAVGSPATGAPSIRGILQQGETLTADTTGGIEDENGIPDGVTYSYQWVARGGGTETDISGATGQTYTLTSSEVGQRIKVRVSFTDGGGFRETLTSAAIEVVGANITRGLLWLSTLEAAPADVGTIGYRAGTGGSLSATAFTAGSRTYEVDAVLSVVGILTLVITPALGPEEVRLWVLDPDGDELALSDATAGDMATTFQWEDTGVFWRDEDTVVLALKERVNVPVHGDIFIVPYVPQTEVGEALRLESAIGDLNGRPPDGHFYQWSAAGVDIPGATATVYWPADSDAGKTIGFRTEFTDGDGFMESITAINQVEVLGSDSASVPWSSTVTVGADGGYLGYDSGSGPAGAASGELFAPRFSVAGVEYTVGAAQYDSASSRFILYLKPGFPDAFTVVRGRFFDVAAFPSGEATEGTDGDFTTYSWSDTDPDWSAGDRVAVALRLAVNRPATGPPPARPPSAARRRRAMR